MTRNLAIAALALSALAVVLSLKAVMTEPTVVHAPVAPQPAPAASGLDPEALHQVELRLATRLADAERRLNALSAAAADAGVKVEKEAAAPAAVEAAPRYVRIDTGSTALTVTQDADGAFSARNSDPGQTGKLVVVTAVQADGGTRPVSILVPAP